MVETRERGDERQFADFVERSEGLRRWQAPKAIRDGIGWLCGLIQNRLWMTSNEWSWEVLEAVSVSREFRFTVFIWIFSISFDFLTESNKFRNLHPQCVIHERLLLTSFKLLDLISCFAYKWPQQNELGDCQGPARSRLTRVEN